MAAAQAQRIAVASPTLCRFSSGRERNPPRFPAANVGLCRADLDVCGVNELNEGIYGELSTSREAVPDYMITRTRLTSPAYDGAMGSLLSLLGRSAKTYWRERGGEGLIVLRATTMNPFASELEPDHVAGLIDAVRQAAHRVFAMATPCASFGHSPTSKLLETTLA